MTRGLLLLKVQNLKKTQTKSQSTAHEISDARALYPQCELLEGEFVTRTTLRYHINMFLSEKPVNLFIRMRTR